MNFRKTFECNERLRQFENKKSGTYRAILFLNKYYHSPASCVKFRTIFLFNYISNASKDLSSKSKLSADEASPFLVALGINNSSSLLNEDLRKTNDFAAQWKMVFNLNPTKAQKKILSCKIKMPFHPQLRFNNTYVNINWESIYKDHFVRFFLLDAILTTGTLCMLIHTIICFKTNQKVSSKLRTLLSLL